MRGQDSSSCSCREQPRLGRTPARLLGMLLLRRSRLPKGSSATAEACRTAWPPSSHPSHKWLYREPKKTQGYTALTILLMAGS